MSTGVIWAEDRQRAVFEEIAVPYHTPNRRQGNHDEPGMTHSLAEDDRGEAAVERYDREAPQPPPHAQLGPLLPLAVAALGVVYGDIGTSPLYALREC